MGKLAYGVGVSDVGEFRQSNRVGGKSIATKEYQLWRDMLKRCYSEHFQQKRPTYIGCTVSENFKNFQWFAEWCQSQTGFGLEGYHLDKDILVRNNKVYSEAVCVFVPQCINSLLIKSNAVRGEFPIGVSWYNRDQNYRASCNEGSGKLKHLGYFFTPELAFNAYKTYKESLIKRLAVQHKDVLDSRVYGALMQYEVLITD